MHQIHQSLKIVYFQERGAPCPQFFSSKGEAGGRRRSVEKEMQGNDTRLQAGEISVKTRRVGGGRQLRDVARRLDLEVEQKQKVNRVFL